MLIAVHLVSAGLTPHALQGRDYLSGGAVPVSDGLSTSFSPNCLLSFG